MPPELAHRAEEVGVAKAARDSRSLFTLAVLAGAFIALGAVFSTVAQSGVSQLPWGVTRVIAGLTFSLGLVLVVVGGAELFTGNNLIVMAWANRRVGTRSRPSAHCFVAGAGGAGAGLSSAFVIG